MPTAEEPLRAAANDGDRLFTVETHPSPGGPSAKGFTRIKRIRCHRADNRNRSQLVIEINALWDIIETRVAQLQATRKPDTH
jgi:hypothetical protein